MKSHKWLPEINAERCTGCGECVKVCGPKSLEVFDGIAKLIDANTCGSEEHCIAPCPERAIRMVWVPFAGDRARGRWRTL